MKKEKKTTVEKQPTITNERTWAIKVIDYSDGTCRMIRTNDGFNTIELISITDILKTSILEYCKDIINPTSIEGINTKSNTKIK